jgi:hypothetical protein
MGRRLLPLESQRIEENPINKSIFLCFIFAKIILVDPAQLIGSKMGRHLFGD